MSEIRTTVPALPWKEAEKGCGLCGRKGKLTAREVVLETLPGKPKQFLWTCKGRCVE